MLADVFQSRLFETVSLTAAINHQPYLPNYLGELGIFNERGVSTTTVFVEKKGETLQLVQSTPRGAPATPRETSKRDGVDFRAPRLLVPASLFADEVQNVRALGSEDQLQGITEKRDEKLAVAARDLDLTLEYHRLGAVQGKVLDADGSIIFDLYSKFGIAEPAAIDFDLSADGVSVREKATEVKRAINQALGAARGLVTGVIALCGDAFWDDLIKVEEIKATYLNQMAANQYRESSPLDDFRFAGFDWTNYQGYGDAKIADDEVRFVPVGVPDLFETVFVPADYVEAVNTIGLPRYAKAEEMRMGRGIEMETQSNPITYCTRPTALLKGTRT